MKTQYGVKPIGQEIIWYESVTLADIKAAIVVTGADITVYAREVSDARVVSIR